MRSQKNSDNAFGVRLNDSGKGSKKGSKNQEENKEQYDTSKNESDDGAYSTLTNKSNEIIPVEVSDSRKSITSGSTFMRQSIKSIVSPGSGSEENGYISLNKEKIAPSITISRSNNGKVLTIGLSGVMKNLTKESNDGIQSVKSYVSTKGRQRLISGSTMKNFRKISFHTNSTSESTKFSTKKVPGMTEVVNFVKIHNDPTKTCQQLSDEDDRSVLSYRNGTKEKSNSRRQNILTTTGNKDIRDECNLLSDSTKKVNKEKANEPLKSSNNPKEEETLTAVEKNVKPNETDESDQSRSKHRIPKPFIIRGKIFKRCKKDDYLQHDYRDPPPRKLPLAPSGAWRINEQGIKKEDSVKEIMSHDLVWDQLHDMNLLRTKRCRTFAELRNKQREILFNMPTLNMRQIRRGKTPAAYHMPLELYEDKFYFASRFLYGVVGLQEEMISEIPFNKLKLKPFSHKPDTVYFLGEVLKKINILMLEGELDRLISLAFYVARHFEKKKEQWWWLANEFYKLAQIFSYGYVKDFGYSEALINYMYGRFQLLKDQNPRRAIESFSRAYELSKGRLWEAEWVTGVNSERIFVYASYLCHIALLLEAERVALHHPTTASKYAERATQILKEGNWHPDLEEALLDLAIYKTQCKQYNEAILTLEDLERSLEKGKDKKMYMCVQVLLALCYQRGGRPDEALSQLLYTSEIAQQWNESRILAIVHKYLGEYYINLGRPVIARRYLTSAIILNNREQNYKELMRNLYLFGYTKGFQYAKQYIELLIAAKDPTAEAFNKLLQFLSNGKPFWDYEEERRYVIVPKKRPFRKNKTRLSATDKVYTLLKKKFGKEFASHAMEEIKKYGKKSEFQRSFNLNEDPVVRKYFKTPSEAEACRDYLKKKYKERNAFMKKEYGEYIKFEIEERLIESVKPEERFQNNLNCVDPIIPYDKDSLLYKQAVETIDSYLNPKPRPDKIYIPYPGPRKAARILNSLPAVDNIEFCSEQPIDVAEIAKELALMTVRHKHFLNTFRDVMKMRYQCFNFEPQKKYKCPIDHII